MEKKKSEYKIAIVLDDLGYSKNLLSDFLELNIPITYAILPGERFTLELAEQLLGLGKEYLLHMPLEPEGYPDVNPGAYSLLTGMSEANIKKKARKLIDSVPGIVGVNNHMGSAFTASEESMKLLLEVVSDKGLYFLDSRTSLRSKVKEVAKKMDYPVFVNDLFLDTDRSREKMLEQLELCRRIALKRGSCIAIGHVSARELPSCIAEIKDSFENDGIKFVTLSEL